MIKYGLALIEKPGEEGLDIDDIVKLYDLVTGAKDHQAQVYPIEIFAHEHESSAMGFIIPDAANIIDFDYENSGLNEYIASILDDMGKEHKNHSYLFKGIDIYLSR